MSGHDEARALRMLLTERTGERDSLRSRVRAQAEEIDRLRKRLEARRGPEVVPVWVVWMDPDEDPGARWEIGTFPDKAQAVWYLAQCEGCYASGVGEPPSTPEKWRAWRESEGRHLEALKGRGVL